MFILYITSRYSHFNILFSKPCQRQCELLPLLCVRRLSSVYFSHFNLLWKPSVKWTETCYDPLPNMAATGNSCLWLADFKKSSPLKPLGQMNRNLVGTRKHLWKVLYKDCSFCPDPLTNMATTGYCRFWLADLKNLLLWNRLAKWTETW
jgi:hypothetical protein